MVAHAFNLITEVAEQAGNLEFNSSLVLHSKFQTSQGYTVGPCLKKILVERICRIHRRDTNLTNLNFHFLVTGRVVIKDIINIRSLCLKKLLESKKHSKSKFRKINYQVL